jgi:hypothetical protein
MPSRVRANLGAFPDQHQRFGILQPRGEDIVILDMIGPDRHVVPGQTAEAGERTYRVVVIVEYRDLHRFPPHRGSEHHPRKSQTLQTRSPPSKTSERARMRCRS